MEVPFVREVQRCVDTLVEADFAVPSWEELADGGGGRRWQAIPLTTGSCRSFLPRSQRV